MKVSRHAKRRTRERLGLPTKAAHTNAQKALQHGFHRWECHTGLRRYLDFLYHQTGDNPDVVVYHRHVYIFANGTLITVLNLPQKYFARADKLEREKEGLDD